MTKLILNAKRHRIEAKDGRKVVYSVDGGTLSLTALAGILAGTDPKVATPESLAEAIAVALTCKSSVIPHHYRERYGADQSCGDRIAKTLTALVTTPEGVDLDAARKVAIANEVEPRFDVWVEKGLNPGMVRMNLGNVLRGMARRGEVVVVGTNTYNAPKAD